MCLVHDDGTVLVQVGLPKRLPQKNTVCHVLDERGLEGGGRVEGEEEEEAGEVEREEVTSIREIKLSNSNFSLAGHVQFSVKVRRISTKHNVLRIQLQMPGTPYLQEWWREFKNHRLA